MAIAVKVVLAKYHRSLVEDIDHNQEEGEDAFSLKS